MIYILLLFIALLLFITIKKQEKQIVLSIALLVFMMLLVGLRDESVGVDSPQYAYRYSLTYNFESISYEPLYQVSVDFVNLFTDQYGWWFLAMSLITFLPIGIAICRYSKLPLLSVLIYMASSVHLFPETMNIMRQSVALGLLLLSYLTFFKKQRVATLFLFLGAVGFHFSSIIVLPFYFICKKEFNNSFVITSLIITFVLGFFSKSFISVDTLSSLLPDGMDVIAEEGMEKLAAYKNSYSLNAFGFISTMLPLNVLCFLLMPSENEDKLYKYMFNIFFIGLLISNIIYCAIPFGFRYSYPFFVVESLLFANKYKSNRLLQIFLIFLIFYYLLYLYQLSNSGRPNMIMPYKMNNIFREFLTL